MIARIKKSRLGQALYRIARQSVFGWPIKAVARLLQAEPLQLTHARPAHRAHNARQNRCLSDFERAAKANPEKAGS